MSDRDTTIKIKAKNETDSGIGGVIASLKSLDNAAQGVQKTFSSLEKLTLFSTIGVGVSEAVKGAVDLANQFGTVERTMNSLKASLGGNESSFERLTGFIDSASRKTLESKESVEHLVAELAALGKSDSDIERITNASIALSNVTGDSLDSSFQKINATFAGTGGRLEKLIPELGSLSAAQLKAGDAVDLITEKFSATSNAMASGWLQSTHNLGLAFTDFKEKLGKLTSDALTPVVHGLTELFSWINASRDNLVSATAVVGASITAILSAINPIAGVISLIVTSVTTLIIQAGNLKILWLEIEDVALRVVKNIEDAISALANDSCALINGIISAYDKVAAALKGKTIAFVGKVDIAGVTGLDDTLASIDAKMAEERKKLESATGGKGKERGSRAQSSETSEADAWIASVQASMAQETAVRNVDFNAYAEAANANLSAGEKFEKATAGLDDFTKQFLYYSSPAYQEEQGKLNASAVTSHTSLDAVSTKLSDFSYLDLFEANIKKTFDDITDQLKSSDLGADNVVSNSGSELLESSTDNTGNMGSLISSIVQYGGPLGVILWGLEKVFSGLVAVLAPVVNSILDPLAGMLTIVGKLIGSLLTPALRLLEPIIEFIGRVFVWLYNTIIVPVYNAINEVFNKIYNGFVSFLNGIINLLNKIPFVNISQISSTAETAGDLSKIDYGDLTEEGSESSGSSGGSSASYTGPQAVYINNYLYGTFVTERDFDLHVTEVVSEALKEYGVLGY